jgi:DNA-binding MarR family transcriptional regulator
MTECSRVLGYRSKQVFDYICAVADRDGIAPTYAMIGQTFAMSNSDVCNTVRRLEARGLVRRRAATRRQSIGWHKPVIVLCI